MNGIAATMRTANKMVWSRAGRVRLPKDVSTRILAAKTRGESRIRFNLMPRPESSKFWPGRPRTGELRASFMTRIPAAAAPTWWYVLPDIRSGPAFAGSGNLGRIAQGALLAPCGREMGSRSAGTTKYPPPETGVSGCFFHQEGTTFAEARTHAREESDHHLWLNGRLWWVAFTIHRPNWTKHRIRLSLKTDDLEVARRRRDRILAAFRERSDCRLSVRYPNKGHPVGVGG